MANSPILEGERPSSPTSWTRTTLTIGQARAAGLYPPLAAGGVTDAFAFDFTWHHNIPWKVLRDSWNVALVFCEWDVLDGLHNLYGGRYEPRLRNRLRAMREAIGPKRTDAASATYALWMDRYSGGARSQMRNLGEDKQLSKTDADALEMNVAWQRWNIVEGPKESIRCEDPGSDGFDDFSRADPLNHDRYMAVEVLYHALVDLADDYERRRNMVADFGYMRDVWSAKLRGPVQQAQGLVNHDLRMFDANMWRRMMYGPTALTVRLEPKEYYLLRTRNALDP